MSLIDFLYESESNKKTKCEIFDDIVHYYEEKTCCNIKTNCDIYNNIYEIIDNNYEITDDVLNKVNALSNEVLYDFLNLIDYIGMDEMVKIICGIYIERMQTLSLEKLFASNGIPHLLKR